MDKRVIGKSYIFRWILVKLVILNIRPRKSAKAYKKIWWKEGSPLIVLSRRLFDKITKLLNIPVSLAMRYGSITIKKGIQELEDNGVNDILVLPLYPHYAMSSYETVVEKVKEEVYENFPNIKIDIVPPFTIIQTILIYYLQNFFSIKTSSMIIFYFHIMEFL